MLLSTNENVELVIREYADKGYFSMVVLNWTCMNLDDRQKIIESIGYSEGEAYEIAKELCTAVIAFYRNSNGTLDLTRGYLHISTLGAIITPDDISDFIMNKIEITDEDEFHYVTLNSQEKITIMSLIIPTKDMREVK